MWRLNSYLYIWIDELNPVLDLLAHQKLWWFVMMYVLLRQDKIRKPRKSEIYGVFSVGKPRPFYCAKACTSLPSTLSAGSSCLAEGCPKLSRMQWPNRWSAENNCPGAMLMF